MIHGYVGMILWDAERAANVSRASRTLNSAQDGLGTCDYASNLLHVLTLEIFILKRFTKHYLSLVKV